MEWSAGSAEDRNLRRKHSEIGEIQFSDDTDHIKREVYIKKYTMPQEDQKKNGKFIAEISSEYDGTCGKGDEADK